MALFGTDGVRGIANRDLTPQLAYDLGRAGASVLAAGNDRPTVLIGQDTRVSGDMLVAALSAGLCSVGANVVHLGVLPTPAVAYLVRYLHADAAAMVTASHNSMEYNGIKYFSNQGYKLPDKTEEEIEHIIATGKGYRTKEGAEIGCITRQLNALDLYLEYMQQNTPQLNGLKIAIDCANGAMSTAAPMLLTRLGAKVHTIFGEGDGVKINDGCGSTAPGVLQQFVLQTHADVGFAFDGDGDRLICVDECGNVVDGDAAMCMLGMDFHQRGLLKHNTVVATTMSNMGLELTLQRHGIKLERTNVGDRYVLEKMLQDGFNFGGEASGHIIFKDINATGDGLLTAAMLAGLLLRSGKQFSVMGGEMQRFPLILVGVRVDNEKKYTCLENEAVQRLIEQTKQELDGNGRVLIRPSGTEPLVRVMLEGEDEPWITQRAHEIIELIEKTL